MTKPKKIKHKKLIKRSLSENIRVFLYHDDLDGCEEYISSNFSEPTRALFRWTKTPTIPSDLIPQYYLKEKEDEEELVQETTIEERVERNTVSMYISEEASINEYRKIKLRLEKRDEREQNNPDSGHKAKFIERCGCFVSKFNLTDEDAVVGKENKRGHVNVILKKDFDFDKCFDKDFGTKKIIEDDE